MRPGVVVDPVLACAATDRKMTDGKIAEEPLAGPKQFPGSIAIAGAWGYIGRKFLEAAQALGVRTLIHDPGPVPDDVSLQGVTRIDREADFYRQKADLFHLALHPAHRRKGLDTLLRRSRQDPILVLCEKPMADPERPAGVSKSPGDGGNIKGHPAL